MWGASRNLDLADFDGQRRSMSRSRFQATCDRFPDVLQGLRFRPSLRDAPGDRRASATIMPTYGTRRTFTFASAKRTSTMPKCWL